MLHREISPDNIYITSECHVKLLDFGAFRKAVSEVNKSLSVLLKLSNASVKQQVYPIKDKPAVKLLIPKEENSLK